VFWFERIANDVAMAGNAMRIGAVVGPEGQGNLRRRTRRQTDLGEGTAGEYPADPVLGLEKPRDLPDESACRLGKIEQCCGAVRGDDDIRRGRRPLEPGLEQERVEINRLVDRLHSMIRADDEQNLPALRVELGDRLGAPGYVGIRTGDRAAMCGRA